MTKMIQKPRNQGTRGLRVTKYYLRSLQITDPEDQEMLQEAVLQRSPTGQIFWLVPSPEVRRILKV